MVLPMGRWSARDKTTTRQPVGFSDAGRQVPPKTVMKTHQIEVSFRGLVSPDHLGHIGWDPHPPACGPQLTLLGHATKCVMALSVDCHRFQSARQSIRSFIVVP
ncbi:hypothetical protein ZHAS_00004119 [Anopheles sinensis]|uniref:Uncharacterized protein n=1 Tax=Anopheles sinensis TaxID=74873 RepID=A0A084VG51_ANOSI|nr:hypothetical protein ZHAS_00004119 [Anopheles sinensis]